MNGWMGAAAIPPSNRQENRPRKLARPVAQEDYEEPRFGRLDKDGLNSIPVALTGLGATAAVSSTTLDVAAVLAGTFFVSGTAAATVTVAMAAAAMVLRVA